MALIDRVGDVLIDHGLVANAIASIFAFTNLSMKPTPVGPVTAVGATELLVDLALWAAGATYFGYPGYDRQPGAFDKSIRGKTDQFVLKFRKPAA